MWAWIIFLCTLTDCFHSRELWFLVCVVEEDDGAGGLLPRIQRRQRYVTRDFRLVMPHVIWGGREIRLVAVLECEGLRVGQRERGVVFLCCKLHALSYIIRLLFLLLLEVATMIFYERIMSVVDGVVAARWVVVWKVEVVGGWAVPLGTLSRRQVLRPLHLGRRVCRIGEDHRVLVLMVCCRHHCLDWGHVRLIIWLLLRLNASNRRLNLRRIFHNALLLSFLLQFPEVALAI